jgi:glycosyltransferase involved in cell wall biosynthesis
LATPLETREQMGRAARARVMQRYSLGAMTSATFQVYRRLLEGR